jgi:hypothetical protein
MPSPVTQPGYHVGQPPIDEPSAVLVAASEPWAFTQQHPLSTSEWYSPTQWWINQSSLLLA